MFLSEVIIIPKHIFTEEMKQKYIDLVEQGMCYRDIAEVLGVTYEQIRMFGSRIKVFARPEKQVTDKINIGDKIGHLTVTNKYYDQKVKYYQCDCLCDCGKKVKRKLYYLLNNPNASCGCVDNDTNLLGRRFGRWTVIERNNEQDRSAWLCKCDCGVERVVLQQSLLSGVSTSCGCYGYEYISGSHPELKKYNIYDLSNEYGIGYTTNTNTPFYFDKEDYEKICGYSWREGSLGYIVTNDYQLRKGQFGLHRLIMNMPNGLVIDHINHDVKDNRKANLRICSIRDNVVNSNVPINNKTGAKGVIYNGTSWESQIIIYGKRIHLGRYDNYEDAAAARKEAEDKYFGEYSYDNSQKIAPKKINFINNKDGS